MAKFKAPKIPKARARCNFAPIDMFGSPVEFNINGEGSYKTIVGCIWTILMGLLMIAATVYYLVIYSDKTNVTLSSQTVQGTTSPLMNFTEKGLFFILMVQKDGQYSRPSDVDPYFDMRGQVITTTSTADSSGTRTLNTPTVSKINFAPCKSANITAKVNGQPIQGKTSTALSDFGYCALSNGSSIFLQGDADSDTYSYVEISINPCNGPYTTSTPVPQGSCALKNAQVAGNLAASDIQAIRLALRSFTVTLMLVDTAIDATNYDSPVSYMLNSQYQFSPTINAQKVIQFVFKSVAVQTDKGIFYSNIVEQDLFSLSKVITDFRDRDPNDVVIQKTPTGDQSLPLPYMTFKLVSGNEQLTYTRTYLMILDVIGLVGGVSQVFTVIVIVLYSWYNSIRMEQEMINRTILNINEGDRPLEDWENDLKFSFGEIFRFKYCGCCAKKHRKYTTFEKAQELMEEKTDVTRIIRAVADIATIKEALLTPAQSKLLEYAAINKVFTEEEEEEDQPQIPIADALKTIKGTNGISKKDLDTRINEYLLKKVPSFIGKGESSAVEIEFAPSPAKERGPENHGPAFAIPRNEDLGEPNPTSDQKMSKAHLYTQKDQSVEPKTEGFHNV